MNIVLKYIFPRYLDAVINVLIAVKIPAKICKTIDIFNFLGILHVLSGQLHGTLED